MSMPRSKSTSIGILSLSLLIGISACAKAPGQASSAASYGVMVDLYSGRENPKVDLSAGVAEQIYGDLDGRDTEFQSAAEPDAGLGFRGFVVTPSGDAQPTLRVTQDSVYSSRSGIHRKLDDPSGKYYNLIRDDVKTQLSQDVLAALP
jgi:hypothetical protein